MKSLLVELGEPDLVGDIDIVAARARQRVLDELLADAVMRNRVKSDGNTSRFCELGRMLSIERIVRGPCLGADSDLSACGMGSAQSRGQQSRTRRWRRPMSGYLDDAFAVSWRSSFFAKRSTDSGEKVEEDSFPYRRKNA